MKMKHLFISLVTIFLFSSANAQQLVHWGINFGLDIPTNKNDFSPQMKYDKTLNYNIGLHLKVGNRWFGQTGLNYHINKCSFTWKDSISTFQNLELGYMTIPLQAGFYIVKTKKVSFRVMLGLQYKALVYLSKNDLGIEKNYFNVHNMDLMGGLGLDFYSFTFDLGYRKSMFAVKQDSKNFRDMLALSVGLDF
jgi:hypothetical protein